MIFWPLLTLSQKASINPANETVILDKEKSIDVAKIIKNETELRRRTNELEAHLEALNDSINTLTAKLSGSIEKLIRFAGIIAEQQKEINDLNAQRFDVVTSAAEGNKGLYLYNSIGAAPSGERTYDIGLSLIRSKTMYTATVDPLSGGGLAFRLGIGLKLF